MCAQLYLTLGNSMDCSPPGSSAYGIFQAKYWCRLPFPPPGDLSNPGIKPSSPVSPALEAESLAAEPPGKPLLQDYVLPKTKLK